MIKKSDIFDLVADALGVSKDLVNEDSTSADFLEWDSLGQLTILAELDEKFGDYYEESEELASALSIKEIFNALKI
tara:strand:+ start:261 stop:488 length:228 start_codon:yes stop_codon:yes gene_type:complete